MSIVQDAGDLTDDLTELRHALHADPEVGLELPRSQEKVLQALSDLPLEISLGTGCTSVTGVLRGTADRHEGTVLLRADMDGLPVSERTGLPWRSRVDGAMHACGHDLHTAMLVGAARVLAEHRDRLAGDVVFMFQPGEEGFDGASVMIDEGVLDAAGQRADMAFALHVFSAGQPLGRFVTRSGAVLSASDTLDVTVTGAGGHGSTPFLARDPVTAVAEMVTTLQTMVTRTFDVFDPVVISVGSLRAGNARNVIPDSASFAATIRSFSPQARERLREVVPRALHGVASAHGVDVDVDYRSQYPLTINDVDQTQFAEQVIRDVFDDHRYAPLAEPMKASEDFSRVLDEVPGSFIGLGATPRGVNPHTAPFNHSPLAQYDDAVLPDGAALYAELALRRLADPPTSTSRGAHR